MLGLADQRVQAEGLRIRPCEESSEQGTRLAVWQTDWEGLRWVDALVEAGKAIDLGGGSYPSTYTARAEHLVPQLVDDPPGARRTWVYGQSDVVTDQWEGKTTIDRATVDERRPEEWLLVEAWDES